MFGIKINRSKMGLFSNLSEKISNVFAKLTKKGKLTEGDIKEAMREVRAALLEADVNFDVVKKFISTIWLLSN